MRKPEEVKSKNRDTWIVKNEKRESKHEKFRRNAKRNLSNSRNRPARATGWRGKRHELVRAQRQSGAVWHQVSWRRLVASVLSPRERRACSVIRPGASDERRGGVLMGIMTVCVERLARCGRAHEQIES